MKNFYLYLGKYGIAKILVNALTKSGWGRKRQAVSLAELCYRPGQKKLKNRLSLMTCSEKLQKIFKDWPSFKGLCQKAPRKVTTFKQFAFLTFLDLWMTSNSNLNGSAQHNYGVPETFFGWFSWNGLPVLVTQKHFQVRIFKIWQST